MVDTLILQSGMEDITNLDTINKPEENIEYYKQETRAAARNLFTVAESALTSNPTLSKVLLMNATPRYDLESSDPLNIKPALVHIFNNTLMELSLTSTLRNQIFIGQHKLECSGSVFEARYKDSIKKKFDGIHLFGPSGQKAVTISYLDILRNAGLWNQHLSAYDFFIASSKSRRTRSRIPTQAANQPTSNQAAQPKYTVHSTQFLLSTDSPL